MRKLATLREIDAILPIEGADAIECAVVGGWKVVIKKGEYKPGDRAVYCEIDSWIPTKLAEFLSKGKEPREYEGIKGERLRTVKLRGQLSQGLLLNLDDALPFTNSFQIGDDVS
jgi:RNA ligase (TIGR02306 family)